MLSPSRAAQPIPSLSLRVFATKMPFRGAFALLERLSHAPEAARTQAILSFIGATSVLAYIMYAANVKDNGSKARAMDRVKSELRVNMK